MRCKARHAGCLFPFFLPLLVFITPAFAEPGFSEKYERGYNIFNQANRYDLGNPVNPANRFSLYHPFNPANQFYPDNPLIRKMYRESFLQV